jgi:hypothetical protein
MGAATAGLLFVCRGAVDWPPRAICGTVERPATPMIATSVRNIEPSFDEVKTLVEPFFRARHEEVGPSVIED